MKKIISITLALVMILSLSACSGNAPGADTAPSAYSKALREKTGVRLRNQQGCAAWHTKSLQLTIRIMI